MSIIHPYLQIKLFIIINNNMDIIDVVVGYNLTP